MKEKMWLIVDVGRINEGHFVGESGFLHETDRPFQIFYDHNEAQNELLHLQSIASYEKFVLFESSEFAKSIPYLENKTIFTIEQLNGNLN